MSQENQQFGYVYLTTNLVDSSCYVGQHVGPFDPSYLGSGKWLLRAVAKYGRKNFIVTQILACDCRRFLDWCERMAIASIRVIWTKSYNITDGGIGVSGFHHSEQSRAKMSKSHKGVPLGAARSADIAARMIGSGNHFYGRKHTQDTKDRISAAKSGQNHQNYGKHLSEELKLKISLGNIRTKNGL